MSASSTSGTDDIVITPGEVTLETWRTILRQGPRVSLASGAKETVETSQRTVLDLIATGRAVYGVNTGFGKLASVRIDDEQLGQLQRNLVLSHSAGTGPLLDDNIVRLIMVMKANALAQGHSGVSWEVVDTLLRLVNAGVYPCIPAKGSVGASGDLAPLSHVAAAMMGQGEARHGGRVMPATEALALASLKPMTFGPKEGVALINGTQVSTALALNGLFMAEDILRGGLVAVIQP